MNSLLEEIEWALRQGNFSTGVCCCGDPVDAHNFGSGHAPLDEGDRYVLQLISRVREANLKTWYTVELQ